MGYEGVRCIALAIAMVCVVTPNAPANRPEKAEAIAAPQSYSTVEEEGACSGLGSETARQARPMIYIQTVGSIEPIRHLRGLHPKIGSTKNNMPYGCNMTGHATRADSGRDNLPSRLLR